MTEEANRFLGDESSIIVGVELGDQQANKWVYDQYSPGLFYAARKFLNGDTDTAQDVVADVFVKFMRKPKKFTSLDAVKGYLYKTVNTLCLDHLRNTKRRQGHLNRIKQESSEAYFTITKMLQADLYSELWLAVNQLPEIRRRIFLGTELEGKKIKEIAAELGLPEGTVLSNKNRAIAFLQGVLKDKEFLLIFLLCATLLIIKWLQRITE